MDKLDDHACFQVYRLHHAFGRYYQAAYGDTGFTYPKYVVLKALDEFGPCSLGDLSAHVGVEANTLSPLLKRMASYSLLERARDPEDERRVALKILPFGREVLAEAERVGAEGWETLGVDPEEVAQALATLAKLRIAVDQAEPPKMTRPTPPKA